ncbi:MAG: site-specific DNA-methyltransferase [Mariprofundaceae bacterium]
MSMDKLTLEDGSSMDMVKENIDKLKEIFPDVFTEGKVNFDALQATLGEYLETGEERYSFNWHGKAQARRIAQTPSTGTLRPCPEESVDWDNTQNLFIEGDNLEVLKLLQKSYHKKVKMIYIDPPYNTGKEFIYPDKFQESLDTYLKYTGQKDDDGHKFSTNTETTGRYHTSWLNMMYPRLKLARNILKDDGVIFISIDDNESHNLKKVCDEIFGEENYLNTITVKAKVSAGASGGGEDKRMKKNVESILVFCRDKNAFDYTPLYKKQYIDQYIEEHKRKKIGFYYTRVIKDVGQREFVKEVNGMKVYKHSNFEFDTISSIAKEEKLSTMKAYAKYFDKIFMVTNAQTSLLQKVNDIIQEKGVLSSYTYVPQTGRNKGKETTKLIWNETLVVWFSDSAILDGETVYKRQEIGTLWDDISWGRLDLEGDVKFKNGKKPIALLRRILEIQKSKDLVVLDFFAGSCSTAHAVMSLNMEDNGTRQFIMTQLPEPCENKSEELKAGFETIADIGKERIRRAANKIKDENPEYNGDLGFKVLKLDSSNIKPWDADFEDIEGSLLGTVDNIKSDRSEEDVLYEILLKYGLDLTLPIEIRMIEGKKVFSIGLGALVICLDSNITLEVVEGIGKLKAELEPEIMRVVFKDNGFKDDVVKTNAIQILKRYDIEDVKSL